MRLQENWRNALKNNAFKSNVLKNNPFTSNVLKKTIPSKAKAMSWKTISFKSNLSKPIPLQAMSWNQCLYKKCVEKQSLYKQCLKNNAFTSNAWKNNPFESNA